VTAEGDIVGHATIAGADGAVDSGEAVELQDLFVDPDFSGRARPGG
jgi:hypothetical protein